MFYLARIAPVDATLDGETTTMDSTKVGWLRVIFHGNIRWARPAYPKGHFTPLSPAFLAKYGEKLGVWVAPEWGPHEDERSCHLVWTKFEPFGAKVLPPDVEAGFPNKQLFFTPNMELVTDDVTGDVDIRFVDNDAPDGAPNEYPLRLKVTKAAGTLELKLGAGDGPTDITLKLSGVKAAAKLELGDAAKSGVIGEALQAFWTNTVKPYIDAHTHAAGTLAWPGGMSPAPVTGVSGAPASPSPAWDATILSTQLKFPANP